MSLGIEEITSEEVVQRGEMERGNISLTAAAILYIEMQRRNEEINDIKQQDLGGIDSATLRHKYYIPDKEKSKIF